MEYAQLTQVFLDLLDDRSTHGLGPARCELLRKGILVAQYKVEQMVLPGISNRQFFVARSFHRQSRKKSLHKPRLSFWNGARIAICLEPSDPITQSSRQRLDHARWRGRKPDRRLIQQPFSIRLTFPLERGSLTLSSSLRTRDATNLASYNA